MNEETKVIAITGGPCAGKTSSMDILRERLDRMGVLALFVPEAATELILSGIAPWTCSSMLEFQTHVIARQLEHEATAFEQAAAIGNALIICDRGICDSHAYLSDDDYQLALEANGIDQERALARYDAVFHLESIAKDNIGAYTHENNGARFETAEEAIVVNERIIDSWSHHTMLHIVGNHATFDEKADALCNELLEFLGISGKDSPNDVPILVSACLLGYPCRYDGKSQPCEAIMRMCETHTLIPACPEQLGSLPTPRTPSEVQGNGRVVDASGIDRTVEFEAGAREALRIAQAHGCKKAILKEHSPSCGTHAIYDGTFTGRLIPGQGKTAALLAQAGIDVHSETEK